MEKMWSPWRSQYIDSFKDPAPKSGCIFCDKKGEDIESDSSLIVSKGKLTYSILNLYPYNNGHLMVIPYRHLQSFEDLTADEHIEIMSSLQRLVKALKVVSSPEGFNIGANIGKPSGAGIDAHLHFHIVPRWNGDTNFMPVLGEVKVISQDLLTTKRNIMKALLSIPAI